MLQGLLQTGRDTIIRELQYVPACILSDLMQVFWIGKCLLNTLLQGPVLPGGNTQPVCLGTTRS